MKIQGPVTVELKVGITNGDMSGTATLWLGNGKYPTEQDIRNAVAKFESDGMPDGFRLMTKREYWDLICPPMQEKDEDGEIHTTRFAMPGGDDYDA